MKRSITALMFILISFLCVNPCIAGAVDKIYIDSEATTTWTDSGGDELLDLGDLAADAVVMGSFQDLGSGVRSLDYTFEFTISGFASDPVVGETIDLYWSQSNATTGFDGMPTTDPTTTAEGTLSVNALKNLILSGSTVVHTTSQTDELKISGMVQLPLRYVSVVVHNNAADALQGTGTDTHSVVLTPIPKRNTIKE